VGQGQVLEAVRDRALAAGAARAHVLDLRDEFAREHVLRSLQAEAGDAGRFPMPSGPTALEWPLIARTVLEIADLEHAKAIAHGCTASGPEPLDHIVRGLRPRMAVIAPAREWGMDDAALVTYARARGTPIPTLPGEPYRVDANLWGRAIDGGAIDDRAGRPPERAFALTKSPRVCPDEPAFVDITFARGVPSEINGVSMPLLDLVASLGTIAGAHGVGRIDGLIGRTVYESPAAVVLHRAHGALQEAVSTSDARRVSDLVSLGYADLIRKGLWYTSLRDALEAHVTQLQDHVTGVVRLKLLKGDCQVVSLSSPFAVADLVPSAYDAADAFDRVAAVVTAILGAPLDPARDKA
jgi:argininosuccinate synthase